MADDKRWKKFWDNRQSTLASNYDNIHDIYIQKREEMLSMFFDYSLFPSPAPRKFLDLGAGTGAAGFVVLSKFKDAKAVFVDGSEAMLDEAKKTADKNGLKISCILRDLSKKGWLENTGIKPGYPLIISNLMIHHLTDRRKAVFFKEIRNLLAPGGLFIYGDYLRMADKKTEDFHFTLRAMDVLKMKKKYGREVPSLKDEIRNIRKTEIRSGDMAPTPEYVLASLKKAGFRKTAMLWFYLKFGVFLASK
jgi:cyclopropane fatty-acyl-phospholipid synthase-like methyltransferase